MTIAMMLSDQLNHRGCPCIREGSLLVFPDKLVCACVNDMVVEIDCQHVIRGHIRHELDVLRDGVDSVCVAIMEDVRLSYDPLMR